MKKIEIETILAAAAEKHSWIIRGAQDVLRAWEMIEVPEDYSGPRRLDLWEVRDPMDKIFSYYLLLDEPHLFRDYSLDYPYADVTTYGVGQYAFEGPQWSVGRARKMLAAMEEKLPKFFQGVHAAIDGDSEIGQKAARILAALSA